MAKPKTRNVPMKAGAANVTKPTAKSATKSDTADYSLLLGEVKVRIRHAQYEALKAVNHELVQLNWDIGRMIVKRQKDEKWGRAVVEPLAKDLQSEFPGVGGF